MPSVLSIFSITPPLFFQISKLDSINSTVVSSVFEENKFIFVETHPFLTNLYSHYKQNTYLKKKVSQGSSKELKC